MMSWLISQRSGLVMRRPRRRGFSSSSSSLTCTAQRAQRAAQRAQHAQLTACTARTVCTLPLSFCSPFNRAGAHDTDWAQRGRARSATQGRRGGACRLGPPCRLPSPALQALLPFPLMTALTRASSLAPSPCNTTTTNNNSDACRQLRRHSSNSSNFCSKLHPRACQPRCCLPERLGASTQQAAHLQLPATQAGSSGGPARPPTLTPERPCSAVGATALAPVGPAGLERKSPVAGGQGATQGRQASLRLRIALLIGRLECLLPDCVCTDHLSSPCPL